VATARVRAGTLTQADLLRVRVALANAKQQAIAAAAQAEVVKVTLLDAIGLAPDAAVELVEPPLGRATVPSPEAATRVAEERRPEVAQAVLRRRAAARTRTARTLSLLPEADVEGGYLRTDGQLFAPLDQWFIGVRASWTVWEWGATWFQARAAAREAAAVALEAEDVRRGVAVEVQSALAQLRAAESAVAVAEEAIASAEEAFRVEQKLVETGLATTTDLLDAQAALTTARRITRVARNERDIVDGLDRGRCALALVVPADFTEAPNGTATMQAIVDGTDANSAQLGIRYAQAVVQRYARDVRVAWLARQGGAMGLAPSIELRSRAWFNEDLASSEAIVPGVVALVLAMIGSFLTALTVAREWERGTMEQLVSTPVTRLELLVGKLVPYFVIGAVESIFCLLVARFWFHVPLRGSWLALLGATALFLIASLTLGYLISVRAKSQLDASRISILATFLPSLMLSGFIFPIDQMPVALRAISTLVPARYFVTLLRTIFLKGSAPSLIWGDLLALTVAAVVFGVLATLSFRKRLG